MTVQPTVSENSLTETEIKLIVRAVLDAEKDRREPDIDDIVKKAVWTILKSFGIEEDDNKEMKADFIHLRKWRKSMDQATSLTFRTVVATIATGILAAVWLGIKAMLGK